MYQPDLVLYDAGVDVHKDDALEQSAQATDERWREAIVTRSPLMLRLLEQARLVAQSDVSVLINGQSGTGKEIFAQAIHNASPRNSKPFIAINCGALPEQLLESELFGHARGAFTGAVRNALSSSTSVIGLTPSNRTPAKSVL